MPTLRNVFLCEGDVGGDRAVKEAERVALEQHPDRWRHQVESTEYHLTQRDVRGGTPGGCRVGKQEEPCESDEERGHETADETQPSGVGSASRSAASCRALSAASESPSG